MKINIIIIDFSEELKMITDSWQLRWVLQLFSFDLFYDHHYL